jgi:hypothetical protein
VDAGRGKLWTSVMTATPARACQVPVGRHRSGRVGATGGSAGRDRRGCTGPTTTARAIWLPAYGLLSDDRPRLKIGVRQAAVTSDSSGYEATQEARRSFLSV